MSLSLNLFIVIITVFNIIACLWLIYWTTKKHKGEAPAKQGDTTGHTWDDNLQEYNNPLPRWWLWLFYITIAFAFIYFYFYPGLGSYTGNLDWSQTSSYEQEMARSDKKYGVLFAEYRKQAIPELAQNQRAMESGQRLFLNHCATCHGTDAGGTAGFPNLSDNTWLYGGTAETIKFSIMHGRSGVMPPLGAGLSDDKLHNIASYVISLSRSPDANADLADGKAQFQQLACGGCHGADAKGNPALGAPNLTDSDWLYGGSLEAIKQTIKQGRNGQMPAHKDLLGEDKVHLLAAYVYHLSH